MAKDEDKKILFANKIGVRYYAFNIFRTAVCFSGLLTFILLFALAPSMRRPVFYIVFAIHSVFFTLGIVKNLMLIISCIKVKYNLYVTENTIFYRVKAAFQGINLKDIIIFKKAGTVENIDTTVVTANEQSANRAVQGGRVNIIADTDKIIIADKDNKSCTVKVGDMRGLLAVLEN